MMFGSIILLPVCWPKFILEQCIFMQVLKLLFKILSLLSSHSAAPMESSYRFSEIFSLFWNETLQYVSGDS